MPPFLTTWTTIEESLLPRRYLQIPKDLQFCFLYISPISKPRSLKRKKNPGNMSRQPLPNLQAREKALYSSRGLVSPNMKRKWGGYIFISFFLPGCFYSVPSYSAKTQHTTEFLIWWGKKKKDSHILYLLQNNKQGMTWFLKTPEIKLNSKEPPLSIPLRVTRWEIRTYSESRRRGPRKCSVPASAGFKDGEQSDIVRPLL